MELKKNEVYTMTIEDLGSEGEGIGKIDGFTLFVKDAVIGDEIEVKVIKLKKNYGYGRLMKIIKPSEFRTEPLCPNAKACRLDASFSTLNTKNSLNINRKRSRTF